jgi:hypothetical protein
LNNIKKRWFESGTSEKEKIRSSFFLFTLRSATHILSELDLKALFSHSLNSSDKIIINRNEEQKIVQI